MDVAHVRERVRAIQATMGDPEVAHIMEDDLHAAVLREIAEASTDEPSRSLAREAIKTAEINFERWCG